MEKGATILVIRALVMLLGRVLLEFPMVVEKPAAFMETPLIEVTLYIHTYVT